MDSRKSERDLLNERKNNSAITRVKRNNNNAIHKTHKVDIMRIQTFIQSNRKEIDTIIQQYYKSLSNNDKERYEWILSDEGLYRWAHQEGVNI